MNCFVGFLVLGCAVAALHYLSKWYARTADEEAKQAAQSLERQMAWMQRDAKERADNYEKELKARHNASNRELFLKYGAEWEYDSMMQCFRDETRRQRQTRADIEYLSWIIK